MSVPLDNDVFVSSVASLTDTANANTDKIVTAVAGFGDVLLRSVTASQHATTITRCLEATRKELLQPYGKQQDGKAPATVINVTDVAQIVAVFGALRRTLAQCTGGLDQPIELFQHVVGLLLHRNQYPIINGATIADFKTTGNKRTWSIEQKLAASQPFALITYDATDESEGALARLWNILAQAELTTYNFSLDRLLIALAPFKLKPLVLLQITKQVNVVVHGDAPDDNLQQALRADADEKRLMLQLAQVQQPSKPAPANKKADAGKKNPGQERGAVKPVGPAAQNPSPGQIELRLAAASTATNSTNAQTPKISLRVRGRQAQRAVDACADSGSTIDVIDQSFAEALRLPIEASTSSINGATPSSSLTAIGRVPFVWVECNNRKHKLKNVFVVNNLFCPLLLGAPSLNEIGASIVPSNNGLRVSTSSSISKTSTTTSTTTTPTTTSSTPSPTTYRFATRADELYASADLDGFNNEQRQRVLAACKRLDAAKLIIGANSPGHKYPHATDAVEHHLQLRPDAKTNEIFTRFRFKDPRQIATIEHYFDGLIQEGICYELPPGERAETQLTPLLVDKKDEQGNVTGQRVVVNAVAFNNVNVPERYEMDKVSNVLAFASQGHFISKIDLSNAYWQIPLDEASQKFMTVRISPTRLVRFARVVQGVNDSGAPLDRLLRLALHDIDNVKHYADDIVMTAATPEDAVAGFERFVERAIEHKLTISATKAKLFARRLVLLGADVTCGSIRPSASNIEGILRIRPPTSRADLQRILACIRAQQRFIPGLSMLTEPFSSCLKPNTTFVWNERLQEQLERCLVALRKHAVLTAPDNDTPLNLYCDASGNAVGWVCTQQRPDGERIVACGGRMLKKHERNRDTIEKEVTAMVVAVNDNHQLLADNKHKFMIFTDNQTAAALMRMPLDNKSSALRNAVARLQSLNFEIRLVSAQHNIFADLMSRQVQHSREIVAVLNPSIVNNNDDDDDNDANDKADDDDNPDNYEEVLLAQSTPTLSSASSTAPPSPTRASTESTSTSTTSTSNSSTSMTSTSISSPTSSPMTTSTSTSTTSNTTSSNSSSTSPSTSTSTSTTSTTPHQRQLPIVVDTPVQGAPLTPSSTAYSNYTYLETDDRTKHFIDCQKQDRSLDIWRDAAKHGTRHGPGHPFYDRSGLLCLSLDDGRQPPIVPTSMRAELALCAHDGSDGGHHGKTMTLFQLANAAYWPGMKQDVDAVVDKCVLCKTNKQQKPNADASKLPLSGLRGSHLIIDFMPMPLSKHYTGIFVGVDKNTGFTMALPVVDKSAQSAVLALAHFISLTGLPTYLESDAATETRSHEFQNELKARGITHIEHSPHNHQSIGAGEWRVGKIKEHLLTALRTNNRPWPLALPNAVRSVNVAPNSARGVSAFHLMFGYSPITHVTNRLLGAAARRPQSLGEPPVPTDDDGARQFSERIGDNINKLNAAAVEHHQQSQRRNAKHLLKIGDSRDNINVGTFVLVANNDKLAPTKWQNKQRQQGPYRVDEIDKQRRRARIVRLADGQNCGWRNINQLQFIAQDAVESMSLETNEPGAWQWRGARDPRALLPSEQTAVARNQLNASSALATAKSSSSSSSSSSSLTSTIDRQRTADERLAADRAEFNRRRIALINTVVPDGAIVVAHADANARRPELLTLRRPSDKASKVVTIARGHPRWNEFFDSWRSTKVRSLPSESLGLNG